MENKVYIGTKVGCVIDRGLYLEFAVRLARDFKKIYYHNPVWKQAYPKLTDAVIGEGLESVGVYRINDLFDYLDEIDEFIFPDVLDGDLQLLLREKLGKRVWGSGKGEEMELLRMETKGNLSKLGLPVIPAIEITGWTKLVAYLKKNENKFIKIDCYRGTFETFHHEIYEDSVDWLDDLAHKLGPTKETVNFIIEDPIEGDDVVEVAYDSFTIDGQYPKRVLFGYEVKDIGYIGHIQDYNKLAPVVQEFNEKVAPTLRANKYRNYFSPEIRMGKDKIGYMNDACCRLPSPLSEVTFELISNLAEIVWYGGEGILKEPEYEAEYCMTLMITSDWAMEHWQTVRFPKEISRWVKLRNYVIIDGVYHILPHAVDKNDGIGVVVAIGNSLEDCAEKANKYADQIKGTRIRIEIAVVDKMQENIQKGEALGIKF